MDFQDIDFQIELLRAHSEPPGARMDYLLMLRKKVNFKKEPFLIKLEDAFDKIQKVWETEFYRHKSYILNPDPSIDFSLPISMLGENPLFWNFQGHINKKVLENLSFLVTSLKIHFEISDESDSLKNIKENAFESIWMEKPKLSIDDFLKKGFDCGLWDKSFNLIVKRDSVYGSKKLLLANIYIVLKEHSIKELIDHKKVGEVFCNFFNIEIDPKTENPFKQFQSGDEKHIKELKKIFG